ncbi:MAG: hypothetical protein F6K36_28440 [Symploca sp. SIO3C6]|nr:hypothetical protein [Symploca sp. SIO3C6]
MAEITLTQFYARLVCQFSVGRVSWVDGNDLQRLSPIPDGDYPPALTSIWRVDSGSLS